MPWARGVKVSNLISLSGAALDEHQLNAIFTIRFHEKINLSESMEKFYAYLKSSKESSKPIIIGKTYFTYIPGESEKRKKLEKNHKTLSNVCTAIWEYLYVWFIDWLFDILRGMSYGSEIQVSKLNTLQFPKRAIPLQPSGKMVDLNFGTNASLVMTTGANRTISEFPPGAEKLGKTTILWTKEEITFSLISWVKDGISKIP